MGLAITKLGYAIKAVREKRGISVNDLAQALGIEASSLSLAESGTQLSKPIMGKAAAAMGVPLACLVMLAANEGETGMSVGLHRKTCALMLELIGPGEVTDAKPQGPIAVEF